MAKRKNDAIGIEAHNDLWDCASALHLQSDYLNLSDKYMYKGLFCQTKVSSYQDFPLFARKQRFCY